MRLDRCTRVANVAPLSACARLTSLSLTRCPALSDLNTLAACPRLERLCVTDCAGLMHGSTPARVARALVRIRSIVPKSSYLL